MADSNSEALTGRFLFYAFQITFQLLLGVASHFLRGRSLLEWDILGASHSINSLGSSLSISTLIGPSGLSAKGSQKEMCPA